MSHTTLHCAEADVPFSSAPPGHGQSWEVLVMRQQGWEESSGEDGPPGAVFITALNHKGPRGVGKPQIQTQLALDTVSTQQSIAVTRSAIGGHAPSMCRCLLGLAGLPQGWEAEGVRPQLLCSRLSMSCTALPRNA